MTRKTSDPNEIRIPKAAPAQSSLAERVLTPKKRTVSVGDLKQALSQLKKREQQTAVLAELGHTALAVDDLHQLFDQAVSQVAAALNNRFCKVLKLLPGTEELLLVAGVGWKTGLVGKATVGSELHSQAGYTLKAEGPVIVRDLRSEERFSGPPLLVDHGVISGMSVIIGPQSQPWGVLGTHSNEARIFTNEDAYFIQAVANTLWDAIDRKRVEDALRESDRRKDQFLAVLAHELRNPLAAISTSLEVFGMTDDPVTVDQSRAIVKRQVVHLTRLVDDLLEVSRITQGRLQLSKSRLDLRSLIEGSIADTRHLVEKHAHSLSVSLPDEALYLDADPVRLSQVFGNLLSNAAKYTPEGGQIDIRVERKKGGVSVAIADNGIGIPDGYLGTIFEMFAGLNRPAEMAQKGLGIGLSLARSLVELHDGKVEARSDGPGKGSQFIVWLPAAPRTGDAQPGSGRDAEESTAVDSKRVLVVDDNSDAANSLAQLLALLGHETSVAYDGLEALEVTASFQPHVVLLDIGLPKLNGYEVAQRIREQSGGDKILLAAVTGWGQGHDQERAKDVGIDRHITKPLTLPVLKDVLAAV